MQNNFFVHMLQVAKKQEANVKVFCANGFQINGLVRFVDAESCWLEDTRGIHHAIVLSNLSTVDADKAIMEETAKDLCEDLNENQCVTVDMEGYDAAELL